MLFPRSRARGRASTRLCATLCCAVLLTSCAETVTVGDARDPDGLRGDSELASLAKALTGEWSGAFGGAAFTLTLTLAADRARTVDFRADCASGDCNVTLPNGRYELLSIVETNDEGSELSCVLITMGVRAAFPALLWLSADGKHLRLESEGSGSLPKFDFARKE